MSSPTLLQAELNPRENRPEPMETDEALYEFVHDQRVKIPPMSIRAAIVAARMDSELNAFRNARGLGEIFPETLFRLPLEEDQGRNRRPDLAYLSYENWPKETHQDPDENAWDVVPDLAIEIISPSDLAAESREKVLEYFRAGVQAVWVVYPKQQQVIDVYDSANSLRILTPGDTLLGGPVLPGFELHLTGLFETSPRPKR